MADPSNQRGRRAYHRYPNKVWEGHKDTIRELFLDHDKSHVEVAAILAERYGLDVGERQIKRWTKTWGFSKNVPGKDMNKMLRARKRRRQQLGRPTKCLRNPGGAVDFEEVPSSKLDAYEKRFAVSSPSAASSGLPSHIMCRTPSSWAAPTPLPSAESYQQDASTPRSAQEMALQFNDATIQVFSDLGNNYDDDDNDESMDKISDGGMDEDGTSDQPAQREIASLVTAMNFDLLDGNYQLGAQKARRMMQLPTFYFNRVWGQFHLDVFNAACYPGSPQTVTARVADILTRTLVRERDKYSNSTSDISSETALRIALLYMKNSAQHMARVLVRQRALQIWTPILGLSHPQILEMRQELALQRCSVLYRFQNFKPLEDDAIKDDAIEDNATEGDLLGDLVDIERIESFGNKLGYLVHLGDGPNDQLLEQLRVMESGSASGQQLAWGMHRLRRGRSRALQGLYLSFLCRFADAEKAFQESDQLLKHETCVEITLHRILWYAEHKTRLRDWNSVANLVHRAHEIFMAHDTTSEFIIHHFPDRFKTLWLAFSMRVPIDAVANEAFVDDAARQTTRTHHRLPSPVLGTLAIADSPAAVEMSILSPQRLFPPTPRGANAAINISAWREFVHYAPATGASSPGPS
ncbi:hypothetical protein B0T18DRAFT_115356 [Schizothecium vesticola]|uniref:Clr5 domain-containing protein n=1 Tax=Schizothecium vesticola TaxID=314040 RepID=A0AA40K8D1_9PEZI|nr:hypothetical protein B0T18DRAFT_115356 [Schizothecium vesticola]